MFRLSSAVETEAFGARLAKILEPPETVFLRGPMGAGKTTLVRGFLRSLGFDEVVNSPTYGLVNTYEVAGKTITHFDLYRLDHPEELEVIGFSDYWETPGIVFIEWPEQGGDLLPEPSVTLTFECLNEARELTLQWRNPSREILWP